jgi:hypothetical protein
MKPIIYIFVFVILTSFVLSIPAGSISTVYTFDKCDDLRINVSGNLPIVSGEYSLVNCSETINNSWYCNCSDGFDLILNTTLYTLNNYTFLITHNYTYHSRGSSNRGNYDLYEINYSIENISYNVTGLINNSIVNSTRNDSIVNSTGNDSIVIPSEVKRPTVNENLINMSDNINVSGIIVEEDLPQDLLAKIIMGFAIVFMVGVSLFEIVNIYRKKGD